MAVLGVAVPAALAHQGNPNFRSAVRALTPAVDGIDVRVVNFDDSLELQNRSGQTVVVEGYRGEPYVRIAADGTVAVNHRSPSYYLNDDRYAEGVSVPADATPKATPDWQTVDRRGGSPGTTIASTGWRTRSAPGQGRGEAHEGLRLEGPADGGWPAGRAGGTLTWVGKPGGGFPVAAGIALVAVVLGGLLLVVVVGAAGGARGCGLGRGGLVIRRVGLAVAVLAAVALSAPAPASAHAVLEATSPARGAQLERAPERVVFRFGETVEAAFGAVRVYDERGERVDSGSTEHPGGRGNAVAVALRDGLGDGTYTATYRVISADSHPVSGGFVFTVGRGGTPAETLDQLLAGRRRGKATEVGFGIVRALSYLALALAAGGVAFVAAVWRPALARRRRARTKAGATRVRPSPHAPAGSCRGGRPRSGRVGARARLPGRGGRRHLVLERAGPLRGERRAAHALRDRLGAEAAGMAGGRGAPGAAGRAPQAAVLRPARLGATGVAPGAPASPVAAAALAGLLGFLCLTPGAGGSRLDARSGLAADAGQLPPRRQHGRVGGRRRPAAARAAGGHARARAGRPHRRARRLRVARFSTIALFAVAGLVASGAIQAIVELHAFSDLVDTAFGRAILIKIVLLLGLVGLGAWNRQRARPRLAALPPKAHARCHRGRSAALAARRDRAHGRGALGDRGARVLRPAGRRHRAHSPRTPRSGPARLELTVDPARTGTNQVHLYLFDRRTGRQWDRSKELTVEAFLPDRDIGPLRLDPQKAGPGHYVIRRAGLAPAGDWRIDVDARVSAFDAYTARIEVPIR